jgi:hypothetical protein
MRFRVLVLSWFFLASFGAQAQTTDAAASSEKQPQSSPASTDQGQKNSADQTKKSSPDQGQKTTTIDHITPDSAAPNQAIEIDGSSFGKSGKVTISGTEADVSSWEDNKILAVVPDGTPIGEPKVMVKPDGKDAVPFNGKFEVKAAKYDKTAFEVLTGVGASFLPVESTSYKVDSTNNALSQTNVARKHLELLLGGGFIMPWVTMKHMGDSPDYKNFHPLEAFLSLRFTPGSDQSFNGFVVGGGWRVHKYFSLLVGYSLTPIDEPTSGFRRAAAQVVAANPTIFPYNQYNANDLANNKPGAFDGFPLFLYNASGVTTTKIFPTSPTVTHPRSGIFFGVGIPVNLGSLLKPGSTK